MVASGTSRIKRGVTLYSYQEEYHTGAMTLEDCLAELASMGTEGVELLPEQMVPDYPNPPQRWVDEWHSLLDKYHLKPACMDTFVDVTWGGHREMSLQESVEVLATQMRLCKRLGFKVMRPTAGPGPVPDGAVAMIRAALPCAAQYDVKIAVEIHSPTRLRSKFIDDYLELIAQTGTKHFGFLPDMGIFCKRIPRVVTEHFLRRGASQAVAQYVTSAFADGVAAATIADEVKKMSASEVDRLLGISTLFYGWPGNDPRDLLNVAPYIYHLHGKFYEMTEDMQEYSIPYDQIVPVLIECGCTAYIDSEYEGQRLTQDAFETDSCEQIRRHQLMLKRLLRES